MMGLIFMSIVLAVFIFPLQWVHYYRQEIFIIQVSWAKKEILKGFDDVLIFGYENL
jgi:hypothetical protein